MMDWNLQEDNDSFMMNAAPPKPFSKEFSTMLSSKILMEEEEDFNKILLGKEQKEEQLDFLSENNSLFELPEETFEPFEIRKEPLKCYEPIFPVKTKTLESAFI